MPTIPPAMALTAAMATEHSAHPGRLLAVVLLLTVGGYWLACQIWPHTNCPACDGAGRHRSPNHRAWRECRRCDGTGTRRRLLARNPNRHR